MRRQYRRVSCRDDEIRVEIANETKAQVSDLSRCGIGLKASKRVRPGTPCMVTIGSNGSLMSLQGTSLWERFAGWSINPVGNADAFFSAGIRFEEAREDLMTRFFSGGAEDAGAIRIKVSDLTVLLSYAESLKVINLCYGGVLAESWNPWEYGTESIVRLFLPGTLEPIKCVGRVASCRPVRHESERKYHVGFELAAMDEEHAGQFKAFVQMRSVI
ncbi:MAG: hypothetical protein EHM54_03415 [Nitrospiraceae bacterium]|jgi:hypothetical protein|nr:MAG: hypothetical protein EHM54_03415 [Nitrospiraceae bacterium]